MPQTAAKMDWSECQSLSDRIKDLWPRMTAPEICKVIAAEFGILLVPKQIQDRMFKIGMRKTLGRPPGPQVAPIELKERYVPKTVLVAVRGVPLSDLLNDECRYECSGSDEPREYLFCGNKVRSGCPYCEPHANLAYLPKKVL